MLLPYVRIVTDIKFQFPFPDCGPTTVQGTDKMIHLIEGETDYTLNSAGDTCIETSCEV